MTRRAAALLPLTLLASLLPAALTATPASAEGTLTSLGQLTSPVWTSWDRSYIPTAMHSAPVVGDVTGDGVPETITGFPNGHLDVWAQDGRLLVDHPVSTMAVHGTVSLGDVNGDGVADIVGGALSGRVFAYSVKGGRLALLFSKQLPKFHDLNGVFASPTVADIDRDGRNEIIATSWNQDLNVWSPDGRNKPGFPVFLRGTAWSSPVVADLDGDGFKDIVVGSDVNVGNTYPAGGLVNVFDHRGRKRAGWPRSTDRPEWSTPSVADIDRDGRKDIVIGSGPAHFGGASYVWAYERSGATKRGWPIKVPEQVMGAPAIGDVDMNGTPDIAFTTTRNQLWVVSATGRLLPGWPRCTDNARDCSTAGVGGPSLADVTGDGRTDVISAGQNNVTVWDGRGGVQSTLLQRGPMTAQPLVTSVGGRATVLVTTRLPYGSSNVGKVFRLTTGAALGPVAWGQFRNNAVGSGTTADVVRPTAPVLRTVVQDGRLYFSATSSDAASGISTFEMWVRDGSQPNFRLSPGRASTSRSGTSASSGLSFTAVPGHSYYLQVKARDAAGNAGAWSTLTVPVA